MYNLPHFKENDRQLMLDFVKEHPFAMVAGCNSNRHPVATQLPLLLEEKDGRVLLTGHLMKGTDHHKAFEQNNAVLCIFTGAHCYVSASWYANPHQASTWNYMSVHATGKIRFLGDEQLVSVLRKTTLHFENNNASSPTVFDNLPEDYTDKLMKAIVAFEIDVERLDNVFKLSQNRDQVSYENIIRELEAQQGDAARIADEMKKRKNALFNLA